MENQSKSTEPGRSDITATDLKAANLTATDINKLSATEADKIFRAKLKIEVFSAPLGQESHFNYSAKIIEAYYQNNLNNIDKYDQIRPIDKDELRKALVTKYIGVIQKNHGKVDGLISSAYEIENFNAPQNQR